MKQNNGKMINKPIRKWADLKSILQKNVAKWKDPEPLVTKEMKIKAKMQ